MSSLPLEDIPTKMGDPKDAVKIRLFHIGATFTQSCLGKLLRDAGAYLLAPLQEAGTPWRRKKDATTTNSLTMHCSDCRRNLARHILLNGPRAKTFQYTSPLAKQQWPPQTFSSGGATAAVVLHQLPGGRHRQLDVVCHLLHRANVPAPSSIDDITSIGSNILRVPVPDQAAVDAMCTLSHTIYAPRTDCFYELHQAKGDTEQSYTDFVADFLAFLKDTDEPGPKGLVGIELCLEQL